MERSRALDLACYRGPATVTAHALLIALGLAACHAASPPSSVANTAPPGPDPIAIALVFEGAELWIGNDDFETEPQATFKGGLHAIAAGFDRGRTQLPGDSTAVAIAYADGTRIVVSLGPAENVSGKALGNQRTYRNWFGSDLVQGVTLGLAELAKSRAERKVLLVIGDGNDTNNDTGKQRLAELAKQAASAHVQPIAIVFKVPLSADGNVITALAPPHVVATSDELATEVEATLARISREP